jgi:hypothetical protein
MKETYLAYFDYLGFKEFIQNNAENILKKRMGHLFRDIELSLAQGKTIPVSSGVLLADLSLSRLNCLNISDTVIFWTNDCTLDSLEELLNVAYEFNWRENGYNFPVRGSVLKGRIKIVSGRDDNPVGGTYSVQCLYGKGLVDAHLKAESQNWAGTVIDSTIIEDLLKQNNFEFLKKLAIKYHVPYKTGNTKEEYVFKIKSGMSVEALKNTLEDIERIFSSDKKNTNSESVKQKLENTKKFIIDTKDIV